MMLKIALMAMVLSGVVGLNWASWHGAQAPAAQVVDASGTPWDDFAVITMTPQGQTFPASLHQRAGQVVTMTGVVFVRPELINEGLMTAAVLAPPARFACCDLTCDPRANQAVFVELKQPMPAPAHQRLGRVSGRLVLHPEPGNWCASSLEEARIEWLADSK